MNFSTGVREMEGIVLPWVKPVNRIVKKSLYNIKYGTSLKKDTAIV